MSNRKQSNSGRLVSGFGPVCSRAGLTVAARCIYVKSFKKYYNQLVAMIQPKVLLFVVCILVCATTEAQKATTTTVPDNSYGKGTKVTTTTTFPAGSDIESKTYEEFFDGSTPPKLMQQTVTTIHRDNATISVTEVYYDCNGQTSVLKYREKTLTGTLIESVDLKYNKEGLPVSGKKTRVSEDGVKTNYVWDKDKKAWVQTTSALPKDIDPHKGQQYCEGPGTNELFLGGLIINEGNYNRFNTYGAEVAFTHWLSNPPHPEMGLTGDATIAFGSSNGADYRNLSLMAGGSLAPLGSADREDRLTFSTHLLAGITNVHSQVGGYTGSSTNLSLAAGGAIDISLAGNVDIRILQADYNPVFVSGGIIHNFRFSSGVLLRLGQG